MTSASIPFVILFLFRYVRLVVNIIAWLLSRPYPVLEKRNYTPKDVTVIIPTVDVGEAFVDCIRSIVATGPAHVIVVTVGLNLLGAAKMACVRIDPKIKCQAIKRPSKRNQIAHALPSVKTSITVFADDHVFWPSGYLDQLIAPFENSRIGIVGTVKRVRRHFQGYTWADFWNFIACLYLERHNMEMLATNTIDGGVFIISGRTCAVRSYIVQDPRFLEAYTNEYIGRIGPLNADDDNFVVRWMVDHGWKIKFQGGHESAVMETTLGEYPKFCHQLVRWSRTTWRCHPRRLSSAATWKSHPWCVYAVYITSFVNFALFYDTALICSLYAAVAHELYATPSMVGLICWILCSKLIKPAPHLWRYPQDIFWLPGAIVFGYAHSLIKLYSLCTFYVIAWGSRSLVDHPDEIEMRLEKETSVVV